MNIKEALKKFSTSKKTLDIKKDSYLCSAFTFVKPSEKISYWDLNYYNPKKGEITRVRIGNEIVIFGSDKPLKKGKVKKINTDDLKIDSSKIIEIAKEYEKKNYKHETQKILLSLHSNKTQFWSVNLITKSLSIIQIKINPKNGEIIESKEHNLLYTGKAAS
jgi:hypothetical protein